MIFLSSWDDGHPLDARVAETLGKYSLVGTFFVPTRNLEGREVLDASSLRMIKQSHEVGSHTADHVYLTGVDLDVALKQVRDGKRDLENVIGHRVHGFCYPGGKYNSELVGLVEASGFSYARTVTNGFLSVPGNRYLMPTTIQLYPHDRGVYFRNYVMKGGYTSRLKAISLVFENGTLEKRIVALVDYCMSLPDSVLHIWGHSWELEDLNLWSSLELLCALVSDAGAQSMSLERFWGITDREQA
jgi:hypothetical protein